MRELFLQIVYGRTQSAFSEGGLPIGAGLEDLGKGLRSQTGTLYGTVAKGTRYLELTEGYITKQYLDENNEVCGYEYVHLGKMMEAIILSLLLVSAAATRGLMATVRHTLSPATIHTAIQPITAARRLIRCI